MLVPGLVPHQIDARQPICAEQDVAGPVADDLVGDACAVRGRRVPGLGHVHHLPPYERVHLIATRRLLIRWSDSEFLEPKVEPMEVRTPLCQCPAEEASESQ